MYVGCMSVQFHWGGEHEVGLTRVNDVWLVADKKKGLEPMYMYKSK